MHYFGVILEYMENMKVALPVWNHRISPVFDAAQQLHVVTLDEGNEIDRTKYELKEIDLLDRANRLHQLDVQVLLCGAISQPLESAIQNKGIHVISHLCGFVDEILQAFLMDQISHPRFLMPGCCGKRRHRCRSGEANHERKGHRRESGY